MGRRVSVCRVSAIIHWSGCQGHWREKRSNKTLGFSRYLHRENLLAWYSHGFSYDVHMKRWSHENYACKFSLCTWNWMKTLNIYFCFGCQGHWWEKQRSKLIKTLYFLFMEYNSACKNILFFYWCLHTLYHLDWWCKCFEFKCSQRYIVWYQSLRTICSWVLLTVFSPLLLSVFSFISVNKHLSYTCW